MYDVQDSNRELTRRLTGCGLDLLFCLCRRASHLYSALSVRWAWPCSASASEYVQPIHTTCRTATMSSVRRLAGWGPSSSTTQNLQSRTRHASAQHLPHSKFLQCTYIPPARAECQRSHLGAGHPCECVQACVLFVGAPSIGTVRPALYATSRWLLCLSGLTSCMLPCCCWCHAGRKQTLCCQRLHVSRTTWAAKQMLGQQQQQRQREQQQQQQPQPPTRCMKHCLEMMRMMMLQAQKQPAGISSISIKRSTSGSRSSSRAAGIVQETRS